MQDRDPYAEGREAFDAGWSEDANPYEPEDDRFLLWKDGYSDAAEPPEDD